MQFIDDAEVQAAIGAASRAAVNEIAIGIHSLNEPGRVALTRALCECMGRLLTRGDNDFPAAVLGHDAFGDPFNLDTLPLARPGTGYAVQHLDTDRLLDRENLVFLPVRDSTLQALFPTFDAAFAAARRWLENHPHTPCPPPLAIVPASYDSTLHRHVLIYGVLTQTP